MEWRRAYDFLFAVLKTFLELKTHEHSLCDKIATTPQAMQAEGISTSLVSGARLPQFQAFQVSSFLFELYLKLIWSSILGPPRISLETYV